ncbi:uncharacterized protein LOC123556597 isoform X1 [Mercenaria mercenaria]|uniref:uncharacterized protein LOC123556597 isoform X1 n=1 Tax=Mercenaria mercenaria TaxID=6596 RepID=UPI00234F2974|nr:uncharacterized protein LOC123556597 isoform X1 [Mercenaria mercenaria]
MNEQGISLDTKDNSDNNDDQVAEDTRKDSVFSPVKSKTQKSNASSAEDDGKHSLPQEVDSDEQEIEKLQRELETLEKDEAKLKKIKQKEELRQKVVRKRDEVKALRDVRRVCIMGDSIIKHLPSIQGVSIFAFPGATIGKLSFLVDSRAVPLADFNFVIIHVGTNNIANGHSLQHMSSDFANLVASIRKCNKDIAIIVSSILPRPVDHSHSKSTVQQFNFHLQDYLASELNFKFIRSYRPFCFRGDIKRFLFAKRDGGLHLNSEGSNHLRFFFLRVISTLT